MGRVLITVTQELGQRKYPGMRHRQQILSLAVAGVRLLNLQRKSTDALNRIADGGGCGSTG